MNRLSLVATAGLCLPFVVLAQSGPGPGGRDWPQDYLPGPGETNNAFRSKLDVVGGATTNETLTNPRSTGGSFAGGTFTGGDVSSQHVTAAGSILSFSRALAQFFGDRSEADDHGCAALRNTASDATPCISATLADAASRNRTAHFPGGVYRILSQVTVPLVPVKIDGDGWAQYGPTGAGTWFSIGYATSSPFPITAGNGWSFQHLGFAQDQPAPAIGWAPVAYPPVVVIGQNTPGAAQSVDNASFSDIFLYGVYDFAALNLAQRVYATHIYGEPFHRMFDIYTSADVMHVSDTHAWPFWLYSPAQRTVSTPAANAVLAWQIANGVPIFSRRNDNPVFADNFAYGYHACYQFDTETGGQAQNDGITSRFSIVGGGCDGSQQGIAITGNGVTGQVANYNHTGSDPTSAINAPLANSYAVYDSGTNLLLDIANLRATNEANSVIAVTAAAGNSDINVTGLRAELWSMGAGVVAPALSAADGNVIKLGGLNNTFAGTAGALVSPGSPNGANVEMPAVKLTASTNSGATSKQLTLDGAAPNGWNGLIIPSYRACQVRALITGRDTASLDSASFQLDGLYNRSTGVPILTGYTRTQIAHTTGAAGWSASLVGNSPLYEVSAFVQQNTAHPVVWSARMTEICD